MANYEAYVQSLEREKEALVQLNNFLVETVCDLLTDAAGQFRIYINAIAETGVPIQECEKFKDEYYQVDENNFKNLIDKILSRDLPMIRKYIEQIAQQYGSIGVNMGSVSLKSPSQSSTAPKGFNSRKSDKQDYEKQLHALCDIMDFLVMLHAKLDHVKNNYVKIINQMAEWGVPTQVIAHYGNNFATSNINDIVAIAVHIKEEDYQQLGGLYRQIYHSMESLGQTFSRSPRTM